MNNTRFSGETVYTAPVESGNPVGGAEQGEKTDQEIIEVQEMKRVGEKPRNILQAMAGWIPGRRQRKAKPLDHNEAARQREIKAAEKKPRVEVFHSPLSVGGHLGGAAAELNEQGGADSSGPVAGPLEADMSQYPDSPEGVIVRPDMETGVYSIVGENPDAESPAGTKFIIREDEKAGIHQAVPMNSPEGYIPQIKPEQVSGLNLEQMSLEELQKTLSDLITEKTNSSLSPKRREEINLQIPKVLQRIDEVQNGTASSQKTPSRPGLQTVIGGKGPDGKQVNMLHEQRELRPLVTITKEDIMKMDSVAMLHETKKMLEQKLTEERTDEERKIIQNLIDSVMERFTEV